MKEIKLSYTIETHDFLVRVKAAQKFLMAGDKVGSPRAPARRPAPRVAHPVRCDTQSAAHTAVIPAGAARADATGEGGGAIQGA